MMNQLFMIGVIKEMPTSEDNMFVIEIRRNYKNNQGVFEKDLFRCFLWSAISKKISLACKVGDLIALKGRLVCDNERSEILVEQVALLNRRISSEEEKIQI